MEKTEVYYFHQTPNELTKLLIPLVPLQDEDRVLEPFKGEGAFFKEFPSNSACINYTIYDSCQIQSSPYFK